MSMGLGIGSFLEGLSKGASLRRSMDSQGLEEERMQLARESAAREAEKFQIEKQDRELRIKEHGEDRDRLLKEHEADRARSDTEFGWKETDRKRADEKYAADKPVIDAQRSGNLKKIKLETDAVDSEQQEKDFTKNTGDQAKKEYDATKSKSILKNADGTYSVDGRQVSSEGEANKIYEQTHGSFAEKYNEMVAPKIRDFYLSRGETQKADGWDKWTKDNRVKKGMDIGGKLLQSYHDGDWNGVSKHFNELAKNSDYWATDGMDLKADPIVKDGKTTGMRVTYKNKETGDVTTRNIEGDMLQISQQISFLTNPQSILESNLKQLDLANAAKLKAAEKGIETDAITKQKNAEITAKGEEDAKGEIIKQVLEKKMMSDPAFQKLPVEEQAKQIYRLRTQMTGGSATPAAPAATTPAPKPVVPTF